MTVFEAFPVIFAVRRSLSISQVGLTFIGVGIGTMIGTAVNLALQLRYPRLVRYWRGYPPPEERLYGAMIAGPCLVIGIFWLGWAGEYKSVPWYVPEFGTIFLGASVCLVFISFLVRSVDHAQLYLESTC